MIVDSSAIMAMLLAEPEQESFARKLGSAPMRRISAGTWIELSVVVGRRRQARLLEPLEALMDLFLIEISPTTAEQARIGAEGYRLYGQGSGHPARLNFGDCFAYALSKATGEPLLFKGDDFGHTDVLAA